jgi:GT2 family glycosyltransferase
MTRGSDAVPRVSVVIPTYRRRVSVERALDALRRQTFPAEQFETVVSIDGSEDGTRESVATFRAPYALHGIWRPNGGRAAACNAGIRAARGALIVLLDDDMEPEPLLLESHVRAHPPGTRRGVLGAVPVAVEPGSPPVVRFIADRFDRHLQKLARPEHKIGIRDFYTGNFSIDRDLLLEVGLFDENFKIYGNEDGELSIRLLEAGVELTYCSGAVARQHYQKDFPALAQDKLAQGRTSVVCALRHPETVPRLRIGTYRRGPRKWRLFRAALVAASRLLGFLPKWVLHYVRWLERHRSPSLQARYDLALDYFYWLGVRSELHEHPRARRRLAL